jgi:Arc/MetJ-type ribon-helix-helix transcriptional regulator
MAAVTLTPEQERFAAEAVAKGRFRDVDAVVDVHREMSAFIEEMGRTET